MAMENLAIWVLTCCSSNEPVNAPTVHVTIKFRAISLGGSCLNFAYLIELIKVTQKILPRLVEITTEAGSLGYRPYKMGTIRLPPPIPKKELKKPTIKPSVINWVISMVMILAIINKFSDLKLL